VSALEPEREYRPVAGGERCHLCREVKDDQHVRHPLSQILLWLWDTGGPLSRAAIVTGGVAATWLLAATITVVRNAGGW
jgi:hypothetical protein